MAKKALGLFTVMIFVAIIYFVVMMVSVHLNTPKAPPAPELIDITWTGADDYLAVNYGGSDIKPAMAHSESDIKTIMDKIVVPRGQPELPLLVVRTFIKHPDFDLATADQNKIQNKVNEYADWLDSMPDEYSNNIAHFHAGLVKWMKASLSDADVYDFIYSLPLYNSDELEFGEVEGAIDQLMITYSHLYADSEGVDYLVEEEYQDALYEQQEELDIIEAKLWYAVQLLLASLLLLVLLRIEAKLK